MKLKLTQEIKKAMIEKNTSRLRALRSIKAQMDLLETTGKEVTQEMQLSTLQKMVKQRRESADIYKSNNREDLLQVELEDISVIEEFLPNQLSKEEVEEIVKNIITEVGATSIRDMGKVMGMATKSLSGKADNKVVSEIVKSILN